MDELNHIKKDYEKALEEGNVKRLYEILDQLFSFPVTLIILKRTGIVGSLKKLKRAIHDDVKNCEELQKQCVNLMNKWKKDVTTLLKQESSEKSEYSVINSPLPTENEKSEVIQTPEEDKPTQIKQRLSEDLSPNEINAILNTPRMNPTRSKFRSLLYSDLNNKIHELGYSNSSLAKMIEQFESALNIHYNNDGDISAEYRQNFRDVRFNIGNNERLLHHLMDGLVAPSCLATMTADEMMNDEVKKEREMIKEEAFEASQTNWVKTHMLDHLSGGFKCRRCGSDKTQYQQKQTRSADEPMTVFIECIACGKRWRE